MRGTDMETNDYNQDLYILELEEQISTLLIQMEALEKKHRDEKAELVKEINRLENRIEEEIYPYEYSRRNKH